MRKFKNWFWFFVIFRNSTDHQKLLDEANERHRMIIDKLNEERAMLEVCNVRMSRIHVHVACHVKHQFTVVNVVKISIHCN